MIALLFVLSTATGAQTAKSVSPDVPLSESVAQFADDAIRALRQAGSAGELLRTVQVTDEAVTTLLATMTAKRQAISRLQQARAILAPYLSAKDGQIKDAAEAFDVVFQSLQEDWRRGLSLDERLLKAETVEALKAIIPDASKVNADVEETWRMLPVAVGMLTHALIDTGRLVDGKIIFLRLTAAERARLIADTKKAFPKSLSAGDLHAVDASVRILRDWLGGQWKAADNKSQSNKRK